MLAPIASSAALLDPVDAPVVVESVDDTRYDLALFPMPTPLYVDDVSVRFVNRSPVEARSVEFVVARAAETERFVERGSYASDAAVERHLAQRSATVPPAPATLVVSRVDFADGSTWTLEGGRPQQR
ncbi:MAG: hypothetical protein NVSMB21_07050 [Vulcanimicrobiaceae bacterium]